MIRSARGWSVKRFEGSVGPDTALYKNYIYLYIKWCSVSIMILNVSSAIIVQHT